jgi:hypothetical protein
MQKFCVITTLDERNPSMTRVKFMKGTRASVALDIIKWWENGGVPLCGIENYLKKMGFQMDPSFAYIHPCMPYPQTNQVVQFMEEHVKTSEDAEIFFKAMTECRDPLFVMEDTPEVHRFLLYITRGTFGWTSFCRRM